MNRVKNILYLGWLGRGNVGDDILYTLFKRLFYQFFDRNANDYEVNIDGYLPINNYTWDLKVYDLVVLGGGSLFNIPYWIDLCLKAKELNIPLISWGTGIDGLYTSEDVGKINDTRVWLNDDLKTKIMEITSYMKYISVRGPLTKEVLINIGVEPYKVQIVGDPALIYTNSISQPNNRKILVNWGTSYNNIFGGNEEKLEEQLEITIQILLNKGYDIVIYPIWVEDIEVVQRLGSKFTESNLTVINQVYDANKLVKLINDSFLTINIKLHANIISAAVGRPFISLAYRGKCFDFAETVESNDLIISTDKVHAGEILDRIKLIEINYKQIVNRFIKAKEEYMPKLLISLKNIVKLLDKE
ncbi:polysaccharide pyruvyl transferase family protein [Desulforamulus hydrothermalis]|uniref:Polysaccharide pyruvyl transferase domain-containing protein n=1 Tax=Desulforamulus hydrothermalis Lam5 = DSM 18033 TaxID=1121428 RepID=K8E0M8_9FIRM|nr:polysaccharide pyruvyl transferase family protein [Desulforamulus hydrothermalis]CCO09147.1 conserved hypothetical protein [Desulforamulus hydrothermalis Lam5 = DSM 18033]SHH11682.1 Polysaccharide pyruvyl transferase family protein WcaK [Desulforamulus hydrothermalis Lam5 = DSM 18033]